MNKDIQVKNENGDIITISCLGMFTIPDFEKKYIMYGMVNDNPNMDMGAVMLGEVIEQEDGQIQVLGIEEEEEPIVVAYYNEIKNQIGGE